MLGGKLAWLLDDGTGILLGAFGLTPGLAGGMFTDVTGDVALEGAAGEGGGGGGGGVNACTH